MIPAADPEEGRRPMTDPEKSAAADDRNQDWLILSIIFWVIFVLLVSIGYLTDPYYVPPLDF